MRRRRGVGVRRVGEVVEPAAESVSTLLHPAAAVEIGGTERSHPRDLESRRGPGCVRWTPLKS